MSVPESNARNIRRKRCSLHSLVNCYLCNYDGTYSLDVNNPEHQVYISKFLEESRRKNQPYEPKHRRNIQRARGMARFRRDIMDTEQNGGGVTARRVTASTWKPPAVTNSLQQTPDTASPVQPFYPAACCIPRARADVTKNISRTTPEAADILAQWATHFILSGGTSQKPSQDDSQRSSYSGNVCSEREKHSPSNILTQNGCHPSNTGSMRTGLSTVRRIPPPPRRVDVDSVANEIFNCEACLKSPALRNNASSSPIKPNYSLTSFLRSRMISNRNTAPDIPVARLNQKDSTSDGIVREGTSACRPTIMNTSRNWPGHAYPVASNKSKIVNVTTHGTTNWPIVRRTASTTTPSLPTTSDAHIATMGNPKPVAASPLESLSIMTHWTSPNNSTSCYQMLSETNRNTQPSDPYRLKPSAIGMSFSRANHPIGTVGSVITKTSAPRSLMPYSNIVDRSFVRTPLKTHFDPGTFIQNARLNRRSVDRSMLSLTSDENNTTIVDLTLETDITDVTFANSSLPVELSSSRHFLGRAAITSRCTTATTAGNQTPGIAENVKQRTNTAHQGSSNNEITHISTTVARPASVISSISRFAGVSLLQSAKSAGSSVPTLVHNDSTLVHRYSSTFEEESLPSVNNFSPGKSLARDVQEYSPTLPLPPFESINGKFKYSRGIKEYWATSNLPALPENTEVSRREESSDNNMKLLFEWAFNKALTEYALQSFMNPLRGFATQDTSNVPDTTNALLPVSISNQTPPQPIRNEIVAKALTSVGIRPRKALTPRKPRGPSLKKTGGVRSRVARGRVSRLRTISYAKNIENFIVVCGGEAWRVRSDVLEEASPVVKHFMKCCNLSPNESGDCIFEVLGVTSWAMHELLKYLYRDSYNRAIMKSPYMKEVAGKLEINIDAGNIDEIALSDQWNVRTKNSLGYGEEELAPGEV